MPDEKISSYDTQRLAQEERRLQLEELRINNEGARLKIEKQRAYLEQWNAEVGEMHGHATEMGKAAVAFAQNALRSTFLLNGGAMIAIPAFAAMLGASGENIFRLLGLSTACFVAGLVCCVLAHFFAYFSTSNSAQNRDAQVDERKIKINHQNGRMLDAEFVKLSTSALERINSLNQRAKKWEACALIFITISILAFVGGTIVSGIQIANHSDKPKESVLSNPSEPPISPQPIEDTARP